jgi:hypothetical protein
VHWIARYGYACEDAGGWKSGQRLVVRPDQAPCLRGRWAAAVLGRFEAGGNAQMALQFCQSVPKLRTECRVLMQTSLNRRTFAASN